MIGIVKIIEDKNMSKDANKGFLKVIIIGDSGVGKTSLLNAFVK